MLARSSSLVVAALVLASAPAHAGEPIPGQRVPAPLVQESPSGAAQRAPSDSGRFDPPFLTLDPDAVRRAKAGSGRSFGPGPTSSGPFDGSPQAGAASTSLLNQPGLADPNSTPPDTTGAIGPSHYIEMVNRQVGIYNRADLSLVSTQTLADFVGATTAPTNVFDPQVQWDEQAQRWLYAADRGSRSDTPRFLAFGWSQTADPTGGWCRFSVDTGTLFDDYPKLGHSDDHIIIGTNAFSTGGSFQTARIWAIPKPANGVTTCPGDAGPVVFGSAANPLGITGGGFAFTPVPPNSAGAAPIGYILAGEFAGAGTGDQIDVWRLTGTGAGTGLTLDGAITVPGWRTPASVAQPGTTDVLDSLDGRITQAAAAADPDAGGAFGFWVQHTVAPSPGGKAEVRWYEILPATRSVRQAGTIADPVHAVFNAAISPTSAGTSAAISFNVGGATQSPTLQVRSRAGTDPLGSMGPAVTLDTSAAAAADFSCPSQTGGSRPCRWGDYAGASPDPNVPTQVWGSGQTIGPQNGNAAAWRTRNFAIGINGAPACTSSSLGTIPARVARTVTLSCSDSDGSIASRAITAGPGKGTLESASGATVTYRSSGGSAGADQFSFTATDDEGAVSAPATVSLDIAPNAAPQVDTASASTASPAVGEAVTFSASASDANGDAVGIGWDFTGDGVADATGATVSHSFGAAGPATATAIATDSFGGAGSRAVSVTVGDPSPPGGDPNPPGGGPNPPGGALRFDLGAALLFTGSGRPGQAGPLLADPARRVLLVGTLYSERGADVLVEARVRSRSSRSARTVRLGRGTVSLAPGARAAVRLRLGRAALKAIGRSRRIAVTLSFRVTADGRTTTTRAGARVPVRQSRRTSVSR